MVIPHDITFGSGDFNIKPATYILYTDFRENFLSKSKKNNRTICGIIRYNPTTSDQVQISELIQLA